MDGTLQSLHHKSERTERLWSLARRVISFSVVRESPLTLNISPAEISNKTQCIHRLFYFFTDFSPGFIFFLHFSQSQITLQGSRFVKLSVLKPCTSILPTSIGSHFQSA